MAWPKSAAHAKIVLSPSDVKAIEKAITDAREAWLPDDQVKDARRYLTKCVKQARGLRSCSMVPGENGFTDAERDDLLGRLSIKADWLEANRRRLGYAREAVVA